MSEKTATGRVPLEQPEKMNQQVRILLERWNTLVGNTAALEPAALQKMQGAADILQEMSELVPVEKVAGEQRPTTALPMQKLQEAAQRCDGWCEVCEDAITCTHQKEARRAYTRIITANAEMVTNHRGVKAGRVHGRFDLLPPEAIATAAKIMEYNLASHGRDTWRKLDRDDHINHALGHMVKWMQGATDEDHLAHALCRLLFANSKLEEDGSKEGDSTTRPFDVVYFSHPCKGDLEGNSRRTVVYVQTYTSRHPRTLPLIPHYMFRYLDEDNGGREAIMTQCINAIHLCNRLVMCGDKWTDGMKDEMAEAQRLGIPVLTMANPYSQIGPLCNIRR